MNDTNDDFDTRLSALFREEHAHVPAEPFVPATLRAIALERKRAAVARTLVGAAGLLALIALSPMLVEGSTWLSARLDALFAAASRWLASPLGLAAASFGALVAVAAKRARIW